MCLGAWQRLTAMSMVRRSQRIRAALKKNNALKMTVGTEGAYILVFVLLVRYRNEER